MTRKIAIAMNKHFLCRPAFRRFFVPVRPTLALAGLLGVGAVLASSIRATTYTWTAGGQSNNWAVAANWQNDMAPASSLTDTDISYNNSSYAYPQVGTNFDIHSLTFNTADTATTYDFNSGSLDVGAGGLTQNSAPAQTFDIAVTLGADQTWTLASGTGALTFNDGINTSGFALTINAATTTGGGNTISGALAGSGALTKTGAGTLTLTGTGTSTGGTTVNAGTLILNNGANAAVTVNNAAGLQVQTNATIAGSNNSGSGNAGNGGAAVTLSAGGTLINNGKITGGTGSLDVVGGTGGTAVTLSNGGTLTNSSTITGGSGGGGLQGGNGGAAVTLSGGGALNNSGSIVGGSGGGGSDPSFGGATGTGVTISGSGSLINSGSITGSTGVVFSGADGTLLNQRGGSISGGVVMGNFANGVTLQIGSTISGGLNMGTSSSATLTLTDDGTGGSQTYSGAVSGTTTFAGTLTKTGSGTWIIDQAFGYAGDTVVRGGTLSVSDPSLLGASSSSVDLFSGASLVFTNSAVTTARTYNLGTSTLSPASGGTITYSRATMNGGILGAGNQVLANGTSLNDTRTTTSTVLSESGGTVSFTDVTLSGSGTFTQAAGAILNSTGDFTANPQTTTTINGLVNTTGGYFSGALTINNGGRVSESGSTSLYLNGSAGTTVNKGGTLAAASGSTIELGGLLTNNGTQTGTLDVNQSGVLKGSGTFGTVNVNSGGTFSPGNSPGTATVSSLNLQSAGSYQFELTSATTANNNPGNDADLISVSKLLTISAGTANGTQFTIALISLNSSDNAAALSDFDPTKSYRFVLVTSTGINGFSASEFTVNTNDFANSLDGGSFSVVEAGNNLDLLFTPVPEPSTWAMLGLGAAWLGLRLPRRADRA